MARRVVGITALRAYAGRVRSFGGPLLMTGLVVLLGLVALTQPIWVFEQRSPGGDIDRWTFGSTIVTREAWVDGVWAGTAWTPYTSPTFHDYRMREVMGTAYLVAGLAVACLVAFGAVQFAARSRRVLEPIVPLVGVIALGFSAAAVVYPVLAVPPAASLDVSGAIAGFSGTAPGPGSLVLAWGGGAAWWLWIAATLLALVPVVVPVLQRRTLPRPAAIR